MRKEIIKTIKKTAKCDDIIGGYSECLQSDKELKNPEEVADAVIKEIEKEIEKMPETFIKRESDEFDEGYKQAKFDIRRKILKNYE